jgi:hypothetical protein
MLVIRPAPRPEPRRNAGRRVVITGFVLVMMLVVEYLNVVTRGALRQRLQKGGGLAFGVAVMLLGY